MSSAGNTAINNPRYQFPLSLFGFDTRAASFCQPVRRFSFCRLSSTFQQGCTVILGSISPPVYFLEGFIGSAVPKPGRAPSSASFCAASPADDKACWWQKFDLPDFKNGLLNNVCCDRAISAPKQTYPCYY